MDITNALRTRGIGVGKKLIGDAQSGDVRAGKTFSNADGNDKVGTLAVRATSAQTVTPGTTNIVKQAGIYDGDITILGDADLIAANIKNGVNIFGVTGTAPIPSGTAVAADVLTGKTFSNGSGTNIAGTMPNRGAVTITPGTTNQTIASGYHNGSGVVQGDPDLIASNIRSGVNIFGVVGTVIEGKRSASGNFTSTHSSTNTVSGLSFQPSVVLMSRLDYWNVPFYVMYDFSSHIRGIFYHGSQLFQGTWNVTRTATSFTLTAQGNIFDVGSVYNWIAFE